MGWIKGSVGEKKLRFCPVQSRDVVCDGLCRVVWVSDDSRESGFHLCPIEEAALDKALNCR